MCMCVPLYIHMYMYVIGTFNMQAIYSVYRTESELVDDLKMVVNVRNNENNYCLRVNYSYM